MKNNLFLIVLIIIVSCKSGDQKTETENDKHKVTKHIGLIAYDPLIDTVAFNPCNEQSIIPYFHHKDLSYKGEKPALVNEYKSLFKPSGIQENGYMTIRFIVNCDGATGRFRVIEMDTNYELKSFSKDLVSQLITITRSLKGWDVMKKDGVSYDYVRYITFKIQNGQVIDFLP